MWMTHRGIPHISKYLGTCSIKPLILKKYHPKKAWSILST
ncbi:unnamed protein product [Nezara viridula]|uniref:Uncharacterized protein n=1 Tax=Nezara viridula TaxID=85310 RepID=A0A9P0HU26_NEZVI|nr:unnamed protein product [Nezara viridula]